MSSTLIRISDDFWNVRGSFRLGGLIDIGTHMSLVRRPSGRFVLLDACPMSSRVERELNELTDGGDAIEAVLHLHPFHTVSVADMHLRYPAAALFGTARHISKAPDLPWQAMMTNEKKLHRKFNDVLDFSVPAGVDFISDNENVHFSSVLAYHRESKTIHSDDTIMYVRFPRALGVFGLNDALTFHPTLAKALERRAGAAADFRRWAEALASDWGDARAICAAHTATMHDLKATDSSIGERLLSALDKVDSTLKRHENRYA